MPAIRFIHHCRVEQPGPGETAVEARERLRDKFPRSALRRMTHLGMLVGSSFDGVSLRSDDAMVYASTFAETRALEDFLGSFPTASPLLFQTSIHPGSVQQVLIGRQQPVARLWPLAGRARLVEQAFLTAVLETAARVVLVGGEERGTWLLDHDMASGVPFAFALLLTRESAGALGRITLDRAPAAGAGLDPASPKLPELAAALGARRPLAWRGAGGGWSLDWT